MNSLAARVIVRNRACIAFHRALGDGTARETSKLPVGTVSPRAGADPLRARQPVMDDVGSNLSHWC